MPKGSISKKEKSDAWKRHKGSEKDDEVFREEKGRQDTLKRMVASILPIYSDLNFFVNAISISYCCSQVLCHIFKGLIRNH